MASERDLAFGSPFERIFVGLVAAMAGIVLVYLAVQGPLVGQDAVNLVLLAPLLIIGAVALFARKTWAKDLLIATPLFLIYYAISYTIGWEWSSPAYTTASGIRSSSCSSLWPR